jgi:hypothetical protein
VLDTCARFDGLDVHVALQGALDDYDGAGRVALAGQLMLSATAFNALEVGGAFGGYVNHDDSGQVHYHSSVARVFAKLRLWPLPFLPPSTGLRIALTFDWTMTAGAVGLDELPGVDTTAIALHFAHSLGPVDLDVGIGALGYTLPEGLQPKLSVSATAALPLLGGRSPAGGSDIVSICAQAIYRFNLRSDGQVPSDAYAAGCLDYRSSTGYRFSIGAGAYVLGNRAGPLGLLQFQFTWGSTVQNPVAEKWAGHDWGTPDFIWEILGAIDPVLGPDGCVYSDPKPKEPSVKLFCIGKPAGHDEILLPSGMRLPVGKHLEIWGRSLVDQAGTKVADIPWMQYLKSQAGTAYDSLTNCLKTYGPTALYVVNDAIGGCVAGGIEGVIPFSEPIPIPHVYGSVFKDSEALCQAATGALMMLIGVEEANLVLRGVELAPQLALTSARGSTVARSIAATNQIANKCKAGYLMVQGSNATTSGIQKAAEHSAPDDPRVRGTDKETPETGRTASAATPVGRRGQQASFPNPNAPRPRNAPGKVGGREYSGHAFDRMQERGYTPSTVENAIEHGRATPGASPGTIEYFDPVNNFNVITDAATGRVITVY